MKLNRLSLAVQSVFYIAAGINHFWHPASYVRIMPPYFPVPALLVAISGACELLGGVGLALRPTRNLAAYGIAAMLTVFLTVHVHMIVHHDDLFTKIPLWLLCARLLFQPVLIGWSLSARCAK